MANLIGKKNKFKFNAFAFETKDSSNNPVFMVGIFTDKVYKSATTRSGWFAFEKLVDDIASLTSSTVDTVMGTLKKSGKTFVVYLDSVPPETEIKNDKGITKLRYDVRNSVPVGFEIEEE